MTKPKRAKPVRNIMTPWRVQGSDDTGWLVERQSAGGSFDEIVIGSWLHAEAMSDTLAWVRLGDRVFDVFSERGKIVVRERLDGD